MEDISLYISIDNDNEPAIFSYRFESKPETLGEDLEKILGYLKIKNEFDLEKSFNKMIKKLDSKSTYCFSLNMTSVKDFINYDTYFIIKTELFERYFHYNDNFTLKEIDGRILRNED